MPSFVAWLRHFAPLFFAFTPLVAGRDNSLCESISHVVATDDILTRGSTSYILSHLLLRTRRSPYPTIRPYLFSKELVCMVQYLGCKRGMSLRYLVASCCFNGLALATKRECLRQYLAERVWDASR